MAAACSEPSVSATMSSAETCAASASMCRASHCERWSLASEKRVPAPYFPVRNPPRKADRALEGLTIHAVERVDEAIALVRGLD